MARAQRAGIQFSRSHYNTVLLAVLARLTTRPSRRLRDQGANEITIAFAATDLWPWRRDCANWTAAVTA